MANAVQLVVGGTTYDIRDGVTRDECERMIGAVEFLENLNFTFNAKTFIDYRDGSVVSYDDATFRSTSAIIVKGGQKLYVSNYRNPVQVADLAGLAFYAADGTFISGVQYTAPNSPLMLNIPSNAEYVRITAFTNVEGNLEVFQTNYNASEISLHGKITPISSTPSAPYNNANTLPVGEIVTYIGSQNAPSNLPSGFNENVFTIVTENYRTAVKGGAVQKLYGVSSSFYRYADNESAYGQWIRRGLESNVAVYSSAQFISPWNDCDTVPIGTIVTYIGSSYLPAHCPAGTDSTATLLTINYHQTSMGGSVQLWFDQYNVWFRLATTESAYVPWVSLNSAKQMIHSESVFSLFETLGVIGDSYASGALTLESYSGGDHYAISWPQIVARKCGITATNFSKGGLTTKTWLTDDHGLSLLNSESAKDIYICALGINDNASGGSAYLGSASDIGTDADTFYGNYAKIISAIQTKAPNAKIVLSTMAPTAPGSYVSQYNTAIQTIAAHFQVPCMIQGDDPFFTSPQYINNILYNHPTAGGYAHMANAFDRMLCKVMDENVSYFANVGINKS